MCVQSTKNHAVDQPLYCMHSRARAARPCFKNTDDWGLLRLGIPVGPGAWDWAYLWVPALRS